MRRSWLALAVVAAIVLPAPVRAGDTAKPLRTLTYRVALVIGILRRGSGDAPQRVLSEWMPRENNDRLTSGDIPNDGAPNATIHSAGMITVNVVAATGDGGLVVDMAEDATDRVRPTVRLAVTDDGAVDFDPRRGVDVTEEEVALARWLSRGFYGDHPTVAGTQWTVDQSGGGISAAEHYRVLGAGEHTVTLQYDRDEKDRTGTLAATSTGSIEYDTALVVPVRADYQGRLRSQRAGTLDETQTAVSLTLVEDSFAAR